MAVLERTYNVPLRKEWLKVPKYQRAAKASRALRQFCVRHMKSEDIIIGPFVNMELWSHGMRNPPHHVKINAVKDDKGQVIIELFGKPMPARKAAPMEKGAVKKAVEAITGMKVKDKKPEDKPVDAEVVKKTETKPAEKKPAQKKESKPKAEKPAATV